MKTVLLILCLSSTASFAGACYCELSAGAPLSASYKLPAHELGKEKVSFFDLDNDETQELCRKDCQLFYKKQYPDPIVNQLLEIHANSLIRKSDLGYNCTGPTTIKYPLRMKALMDDRPIGVVRFSMGIVHLELSCLGF